MTTNKSTSEQNVFNVKNALLTKYAIDGKVARLASVNVMVELVKPTSGPER